MNNHITPVAPPAPSGSCGSDSKCSSDSHCNTECLKMKSWQCGEPQAKGPVLHNGHLYLNLVDGNLSDPALGVGEGTYAGAFDLVSLIEYLINNQ